MLSFLFFYTSSSLESVVLTITAVANALIALSVFRNNPKSATNILFTLLTLCTVSWLEVTYLVRIPELFGVSLLLHRLGIFFAAPMSLMLFLLCATLPSERIPLPKRRLYICYAATLFMMVLNISPFAFVSVAEVNGSSVPQPGLGIIPFGAISTLFSVLAVYLLIQSYRRAEGVMKKQISIMLTGIVGMLTLIICTIFIPLVFLDSTAFLPFAPLYVLLFLSLTAYAITKYQLFNVKVLLAQTLTLAIEIVLFSKTFGETTLNARVIDGTILVFTIVAGFFLTRSVKSEVRSRELIEKQEKELEITNEKLKEMDKQKSEFLSYASHQLRTPLTAIKWSAGSILDGTFGVLSKELQEPIQTILDEGTLMTTFITDYLNVSRIEQGKMEYRFAATNIVAIVRAAAKQLESGVAQKGLTLAIKSSEETIMVWADAGKLTQVVSNLIDNAMKYTPKGGITTTVTRLAEEKKVRIQILDTGIGMDQDTLSHVFDKFVRGENAKVVNSAGSGLGLFIVKTFVEAHNGTIEISSKGVGHGSVFTLEFPLFVS